MYVFALFNIMLFGISFSMVWFFIAIKNYNGSISF